MGVITSSDIDYGHIFGPFPSHVTPADPAYLIGMLTNDRKPDALMLKMDPGEKRPEGLRSVDWLPYIQPARDSEEQNMEAYLKEGQVYFRSLRIIRAGEELLVWYSKDFAQLLNIPELPRTRVEEGEHYICPRCGDTFEFPYSLRAHIKFKCSYTLSQISPTRLTLPTDKTNNPSDNNDSERHYRIKTVAHTESAHSALNPSTDSRELPTKDTKDHRNSREHEFVKMKNGLDYSKVMNGLDFRKLGNNGLYFSHQHHTGSVGLDFSKRETVSNSFPKSDSSALAAGECLDLVSRSGGGGVDFSKPFPRYTGSQSHLAHQSSGLKRSAGAGGGGGDISSSHPAARHSSSPKMPRVLEPKAELLSPSREDHSRMLSKLDRSPQKTPPETSLKDSHSDVASAFRKVERSTTPPEAERPSSGSSSSRAEENTSTSPGGLPAPASASASLSASLPLPAPISSSMSALSVPSGSASSGLPAMPPGSLMGLYMPRLPMVPPPLGLPGGPPAAPAMHPVSAHHPAFAAADQIPPGLLEMCRATIPSIGPLTESFANIRNGDGHHGGCLPFPGGKASMFLASGGGGEREGGHPVGGGGVPFLKSNNPMVEKILQSTSPSMMSSPLSALNLSQNWCAKCNASFRMTSDLVYHMRSHHKREFDPMKRKREEKLKCSICNEAFRERHHLTRHMSSHA
ncbi:uncharacterized protein LOC143292313 [Babylonia areolata]|uniref:uncharacterized protein LOC143292313 n=1 Tax=Babylonia areolata TaxID=304850 RepID=UPI003FD54285